ncbi:MAG: DUF2723 domain-containing protein [Candidatus Eremiobacteraeota bacterium]|nr:DUF2723 domain-containing protein [Candidatus Eremiobacteraeota bacterium]MBV8434001.1 DUF2723 domain-containing protein [Candidatus Eremiobacteraeota bacterium]MBV8720909.1 DUF2723 domain-containing protein [Candidatus Eremiobacteraeota bacterium]
MIKARAAAIAAMLCDVAAFAVPAAVYVASVSHEPASWDTAEFQGVPYILGISHPTGFPLFALLGYVWSHLMAVDTIAFRMNAFTGVTMAIAALLAYATALRLGASRPVALCVTLAFSLTQDVWSHANRAEAQVLAVAFETAAIYAFVRWLTEERPIWYATAFALCGLGMAAHPNAIWLFPGFLVGSLIARIRPNLALVAGSLALVAAGLAFYLYLPLRSAYIVAHGLDPTLALGTDGGIFWNYHNPSTPGGLLLDLTGNESNAPHYFLSSFNPVHVQDALWAFVSSIGEQYGAFTLVLAFFGIGAAWRRDWRTTLFLCVACTASLLFSVTYSGEGDVGRYRLLALWLAVPLVAALVPRDVAGLRATLGRTAIALFFAVVASIEFLAHPEFFHHDRGEGGRWVIDAVAPFTSPGSVIMVDWLDATSLAYGAYVDGSLPGRIIVSGWDPDKIAQYKVWARTHRVYILVNPQDVSSIDGAKLDQQIDDYHALYEVKR